MSNEDISPKEAIERVKFLTKDYIPEAYWTVGGAFHYKESLLLLAQFMKSYVGVRNINRVMGAVPCLWSLDWFVQRRPEGSGVYVSTLENYAKAGIGVELVFDNPFIADDDLNDPYALFLVRELVRLNPTQRNAVAVASDKLAVHLRRLFPQMYIHCHVNRLLAEPRGRTRTAGLYAKLLELYNRVSLHPADAAKPAIYKAITDPLRIDVIVNDICLRNCPMRREHLKILSSMRREPYNVKFMQQRSELLNRVGCHRVDTAALHQKATGILTKNETRTLYDAGYRSFLIQSQQFRNELTLLWDILHCMFDATPELSNKMALLATSAMLSIRPESKSMASGTKAFSFSNYE